MASLKRKALTLDCKVEIIKAVESGRKKADVCRDFGLANSTVCTIIKNREKILKSFQDGKGQVKKIKLCEKANIDDALIKWFNQCRSSNLPLNGPILMEKAEEFGRLLGDTNFKCSNGWLDRFKQRHNISFGKVCGEAKSVNLLDVENWLRDVWPKLRGEYADEDIYNADETGIFYKLLPDKTFKFKNEKCVGGKLAKDRITAFVCANMTGTDKRKLLVIGKSKNPRCFKNIKTLPVNYKANKKSWMTSEIFEEEIRKWDKELIGKRKKVLLLVDNCPAHPILENLKNIKLVFLPPNCTSVLQPMDQGIIRSLKSHFRKILLQKIITNMEDKNKMAISLLDAVDFLEKSWCKVSSLIIANCFHHAKLCNSQTAITFTKDDNEDDDIPLSELIKTLQSSENGEFLLTAATEYECVDENLITSQFYTDADIIEQIKCSDEKNVDDDDDDNDDNEEDEISNRETTVPSTKEASNAIKLLKMFYRSRKTSSEIMNKIYDLENDIDKQFLGEKCLQSKITDFF
ncbi:tigger transposable element-derived protein 4-like [Centruroides sculpturatus]|uniref:tigger transposable element-derived protein 4-like n=1 Tax=Centruroides sculpturatus TaxID=218467 RepID=UPI000C6EBAB5|nr:tigger transposable element-derived protein 4-like [Centruroides sculpturatus]